MVEVDGMMGGVMGGASLREAVGWCRGREGEREGV